MNITKVNMLRWTFKSQNLVSVGTNKPPPGHCVNEAAVLNDLLSALMGAFTADTPL